MISELKDALKDRVDNLDDEQAQQAAQAAVHFFQDRLPDPIANRLEELVDGDGQGDIDFNQLGDTISGFLGR